MNSHLTWLLGELTTPRRLRVVSTDLLAADVGQGAPVQDANVKIAHLHSPTTVLREWAMTYSSLYNPPLAAAQRHWGVLKYLSYFDMERPEPLAVSSVGQSLRFTMRRAASEELGEAFSIALAKRWFATKVARTFRGADPDPRVYVINLENDLPDHLVDRWKVALSPSGRRPDFLLACELTAGGGSLAVGTLESKGTGSQGNVVRQLRSAAGQVSDVHIGGVVPTGYIIDTVSGFGPLTSYALELGDAPVLLTKRSRLHPHMVGDDLEGGILADLAAALLEFVGDAEGRDRWISPKKRAWTASRPVPPAPVRPLSASSTFPFADGKVRISTGLDHDIRELLDEGEIGEVMSHLSRKKHQRPVDAIEEPEEGGYYLRIETDPTEG